MAWWERRFTHTCFPRPCQGWIGVVVGVNLGIGQVTPLVAVIVYPGASIAGISLDEISQAAVPFILAMASAPKKTP